jgi:hypothetical protein
MFSLATGPLRINASAYPLNFMAGHDPAKFIAAAVDLEMISRGTMAP